MQTDLFQQFRFQQYIQNIVQKEKDQDSYRVIRGEISGDCRLLNQFGLSLQLFLITCFVCLLIIKKNFSPIKRSWKTFILDSSKVFWGSIIQHIMNIFAAQFFGRKYQNPCKWYLINILNDVCVGTFLTKAILEIYQNLTISSPKLSFIMGDYGYKNLWNSWRYQMIVWSLVNVISKFIMIFQMYINKEFLNFYAEIALAFFRENPNLEQVVVLVVIPFILNLVQIWILDTIVMKKEKLKEFDEISDESSLEGLNSSYDQPENSFESMYNQSYQIFDRDHKNECYRHNYYTNRQGTLLTNEHS